MVRNMVNCLIAPISRYDGMAGNIRIRNLFKPINGAPGYHLWNLVILNHGEPLERLDDSVCILRYSLKNPFSLISLWAGMYRLSRRVFKNEHQNFLYLYKDINLLVLPLVFYCKLRGVKVIVDITEDDRYLSIKKSSILGYMKGVSAHLLMRLFSGFVDRYLVISKNLERTAIDDWRLPDDLVTYLPTTVDLDEFIVRDVILEDGCRLFYGGSFGEKDGLLTFLNAFKLVKARFPETRFRLAGKGNRTSSQTLRETLIELSLEDSVELLGYLSREEYIDEMSCASVHCMTRIDSEFARAGFPFKLAEMLATGRPTICTSLNSVSELLNSDEVVFVTPNDEKELADAIIDLQLNSNRSNELGRKGRLACERLFSADSINILSIIEELHHSP